MMLRVGEKKITYAENPPDSAAYTKNMDRIYTKYAKAYDAFLAVFPLWKIWLKSVLPHIKGEKIIDISFGPGYLFKKLPHDTSLYGLDYNETMVCRAKTKMYNKKINVDIRQGNVENMPYPDNFFDTVINTMAFSGYPNAEAALSEMLRVLKDDGVLLILDYDYPKNRNIFGYWLVKLIEKSGDLIRDIGKLIDNSGCTYTRDVIGGFGSIQLFIITKHKQKESHVAKNSSGEAHSTEASTNQLHEKLDAVNAAIEKLQSSNASSYTNHEKHDLNDLYQRKEEYNQELERISKAATDNK